MTKASIAFQIIFCASVYFINKYAEKKIGYKIIEKYIFGGK